MYRREISNLKVNLKSSEALVANFQKTLEQRDLEIMTLKSKVSVLR